eukprot:78952_1
MAFKHVWSFRQSFFKLLYVMILSVILYYTYNITEYLLFNATNLNTSNSYIQSECDWYHNQNWQSLLNVPLNHSKVHSITNLYKLGSIYNHFIALNQTHEFPTQQHYSKVKSGGIHLDKFPVECSYNGKIFNIGI